MSVSNIQSARPSSMGGRSVAMPQFGLTAWEMTALKEAAKGGQTAVEQVSSKKVADFVTRIFDKGKLGRFFSGDVRVGGLSLEDMSSRFLTLFGLYIPQGILAAKERKHPWETNGRNAVVWIMTFYLMQFLKNDNFGINSLLLNPFMIEKGKLQAFNRKTDISPEFGPIKRLIHSTFKPPVNYMQRVLNKQFGMSGDYLEVLKDAGLAVNQGDAKKALLSTKSPWASLDNNQLDLINNRYTELRKLVAQEGAEALGKIDQPISESVYKAYPKVLRRLSLFPMISALLLTMATVYVIGGVAMQIVYRFIAPLDKDFNAAALRQNKNKKKNPPAQPLTTPITPAYPAPSMAPAPQTGRAPTFLPPTPPVQPANTVSSATTFNRPIFNALPTQTQPTGGQF